MEQARPGRRWRPAFLLPAAVLIGYALLFAKLDAEHAEQHAAGRRSWRQGTELIRSSRGSASEDSSSEAGETWQSEIDWETWKPRWGVADLYLEVDPDSEGTPGLLYARVHHRLRIGAAPTHLDAPCGADGVGLPSDSSSMRTAPRVWIGSVEPRSLSRTVVGARPLGARRRRAPHLAAFLARARVPEDWHSHFHPLLFLLVFGVPVAAFLLLTWGAVRAPVEPPVGRPEDPPIGPSG